MQTDTHLANRFFVRIIVYIRSRRFKDSSESLDEAMGRWR